MHLRIHLLPLALLLTLALVQNNCGQESPPPPPPPPAAPAPAAEKEASPVEKGETARGLRSRLKVRWEEQGPPGPRLLVEFTVENTGAAPVTMGFSNSGRVCGVVRDADGREVHEFPEMTAQVMGEETFRSGEARLFRHDVRRAELGEPLSASYTVEAWLCGQPALKQQATAKVQSP